MSEMEQRLPTGWANIKMTDELDFQGGTQPPKKEFVHEPQDGYMRLLQIRDFGKKPVPTYIPITSKLRTCSKSDVLIGRYGASVGRICSGMEGAYNVALAKVKIPNLLDRGYVKYFLLSERFQHPLRHLSRSAQNGFNKKDLSQFSFPIAPAAEQTRIVEKLDQLLAQVDSIQARLSNLPTILKRFRQSVLSAAVSGRLTEEWRKLNIPVKPLREEIALHQQELLRSSATTTQKKKLEKLLSDKEALTDDSLVIL